MLKYQQYVSILLSIQGFTTCKKVKKLEEIEITFLFLGVVLNPQNTLSQKIKKTENVPFS